jgi:hypothetical protein
LYFWPLATVSKNKIPKRQKYLLSPGGAHTKFLVFGFDKTPCYGFQKLFSKKFVMTPPLHFHHNHIYHPWSISMHTYVRYFELLFCSKHCT